MSEHQRPPDAPIDAVVIGAGPYGLSVTAHLQHAGLKVRAFGEPMSTWTRNMPVGMFLKSRPAASNLSSPRRGHGLADFCRAAGLHAPEGEEPVPIDLFVRYGTWFRDQLVPGLEQARVVEVDRAVHQTTHTGTQATDSGSRDDDTTTTAATTATTATTATAQRAGKPSAQNTFRVTLDTGETFTTRAVVVATGVPEHAYVPPLLRGPLEDAAGVPLVSHTSEHPDLGVFAGSEVIVVGAGQSALESAALLVEAGAGVRVLMRRQAPLFAAVPPPETATQRSWRQRLRPDSPLGPGIPLVACAYGAGLIHYLPDDRRVRLVRGILGPAGSWWLRDRVQGRAEVLGGSTITAARAEGGKIVLDVESADSRHSTVAADHVLCGTGYRIDDASSFGYLSPGLRRGLARLEGWPRLDAGFQSAVPGLYFVGFPAAASFGPLMRFVCGTRFAATRVTSAVTRRVRSA